MGSDGADYAASDGADAGGGESVGEDADSGGLNAWVSVGVYESDISVGGTCVSAESIG